MPAHPSGFNPKSPSTRSLSFCSAFARCLLYGFSACHWPAQCLSEVLWERDLDLAYILPYLHCRHTRGTRKSCDSLHHLLRSGDCWHCRTNQCLLGFVLYFSQTWLGWSWFMVGHGVRMDQRAAGVVGSLPRIFSTILENMCLVTMEPRTGQSREWVPLATSEVTWVSL